MAALARRSLGSSRQLSAAARRSQARRFPPRFRWRPATNRWPTVVISKPERYRLYPSPNYPLGKRNIGVLEYWSAAIRTHYSSTPFFFFIASVASSALH